MPVKKRKRDYLKVITCIKFKIIPVKKEKEVILKVITCINPHSMHLYYVYWMSKMMLTYYLIITITFVWSSNYHAHTIWDFPRQWNMMMTCKYVFINWEFAFGVVLCHEAFFFSFYLISLSRGTLSNNFHACTWSTHTAIFPFDE